MWKDEKLEVLFITSPIKWWCVLRHRHSSWHSFSWCSLSLSWRRCSWYLSENIYIIEYKFYLKSGFIKFQFVLLLWKRLYSGQLKNKNVKHKAEQELLSSCCFVAFAAWVNRWVSFSSSVLEAISASDST